MKNNLITPNDSKKILLDILSAIDSFCLENDIKYSLSCGTLLGAVRHSGFIPWDDDIDICMLRKDYDYFINRFPELLDNKYILACFERTPNWHSGFAKIYDCRTICVDEQSNIQQIGISVDLFPMDEVPDDDNEWAVFRNDLASIRTQIATKIFKIRYYGLFHTLNLLVRKLLIISKPLPLLVCDYINSAKSNNQKGFTRVFECVLGITSKHPVPKSLFDDIIDWTFENRTYKGFKQADIYLTNTFGNYMQLPPEKDRVPRHKYIQYWKTDIK